MVRVRFSRSRMCYFGLSLVLILLTLSLHQNGPDVDMSAPMIRLVTKFELDGTQARLLAASSPEDRHKEASQNAPSTDRFVNSTNHNFNFTYEFVVAHYNEKLGWLKPVANRSHVYHKGKARGPPFAVYKWEKLPNVGREAHTYLHHIVANYNNLTDLTVFLQGHGTNVDVKGYCFPEPTDFLLTYARNGLFCKEKPPIRTWGRLKHFGKWLSALRRGRMRKASFTLGEFYEAVFGTKHPETAPKCLAGCFSATREMIRQHPISLYQRAISFVYNHSNPEESHYMERLWASIIYMS